MHACLSNSSHFHCLTLKYIIENTNDSIDNNSIDEIIDKSSSHIAPNMDQQDIQVPGNIRKININGNYYNKGYNHNITDSLQVSSRSKKFMKNVEIIFVNFNFPSTKLNLLDMKISFENCVFIRSFFTNQIGKGYHRWKLTFFVSLVNTITY